MSLATALLGVLFISGVQQGMAEGQQAATDQNQQGVIISYGTYLEPRREQARAAPNDGEEIQGGFAPLPALGPPEYVSPGYSTAERRPPKKPGLFSWLRPRPRSSEGQSNNHGPPNNPSPRPPRPSLFYRYF